MISKIVWYIQVGLKTLFNALKENIDILLILQNFLWCTFCDSAFYRKVGKKDTQGSPMPVTQWGGIISEGVSYSPACTCVFLADADHIKKCQFC